jgi:dethiobiotin synthetase
MDRPLSIKETNWQNAILMSRSSEQLTFVEMPGGVATPVCYEENNAGTITNNWRDSADMAYEFIQPCIVVVKHQLDAIEQLVLTSTYLRSKGLVVIGCATVEISPDGGAELERKRSRADFSVGLQNKTGVPFLGCVKFSQSISVPRVSQGNLLSLVESGIDLNALTRSLNLAVPTL